MNDERDSAEALDDISEKIAEGDDPSQSERDFLEGEGVELEDEGDLSDFDVTR
jgi:hypothetical protein